MCAKLSQRDTLAGGSEETNVGNVVDRSAELRLVANRQVVTLLADQNLADGFAANGGFDRILNIADVDSETIGRRAVDR